MSREQMILSCDNFNHMLHIKHKFCSQWQTNDILRHMLLRRLWATQSLKRRLQYLAYKNEWNEKDWIEKLDKKRIKGKNETIPSTLGAHGSRLQYLTKNEPFYRSKSTSQCFKDSEFLMYGNKIWVQFLSVHGLIENESKIPLSIIALSIIAINLIWKFYFFTWHKHLCLLNCFQIDTLQMNQFQEQSSM